MADHIVYRCVSMRYTDGYEGVTSGDVVTTSGTSISVTGATTSGSTRLVAAMATNSIDGQTTNQASSSWPSDDPDVTGESFFVWAQTLTGVGGGMAGGSGALASAGSSGNFTSTWNTSTDRQACLSWAMYGSQTPQLYDSTTGNGTDDVAVTLPIAGSNFYFFLLVQTANEEVEISAGTGWTNIGSIGTGTAGSAGSTRLTIFAADKDSSPTAPTLSIVAAGYTITAETGSVAITGTNASLLFGPEVSAESGSVSITGTDADLRYGEFITAEPGAVEIAGTDAGLLIARKITAESGSVAITGTAASLLGALAIGDHDKVVMLYGHATSPAEITLQTNVSGSTFLLLMGSRMDDIGDGPTDSETNTWRQINTSWQYVDPANQAWGVAAWRAINGTGDATAHTFSQTVTAFDEITMFAVELRGAHYLVAEDRDEESNSGTPGTTGPTVEVTTTGPAILIASWWGSGPVGQDHTATPNNDFVELDFYGTNDNDGYIQAGVYYKIVSGAGTYSVTFTHSPAQGSKAWLMAFQAMPSVAADPGSFSVTGTDAGLLFGAEVAAEIGEVAITGTDAALNKGGTLTAESGAVDLTGTDVALLVAHLLAAESGAVDVTGTDATLTYSHPLVAESGEISITGTDAGLLATRLIVAEVGEWALTGTDASLNKGVTIGAESGAVDITGTDAALLGAFLVGAESGAVDITGTDVTFGLAMPAESGEVQISGTVADLLVARLLTAEAGDVSITGIDAAVLAGRYITAESGSVAITGTDADLVYMNGAFLTAESGSVVIDGTAASLLFAGLLTAESGAVSISGTDASLLGQYLMTAEAAEVVLLGTAASLLFGRELIAESGSVAIAAPAEADLTWSGTPSLAVSWAYRVRGIIEDFGGGDRGWGGILDDLDSGSGWVGSIDEN